MKIHLSRYFLLAVALLLTYSAFAQTTKSININVNGTSTSSGVQAGSGSGSGMVSPFGIAAFSASSTQAVDSNFNPTGPIQSTVTLSFNRLDSFTATATIPNFTTDTATFPATITGGKGMFSGASGTGTFTVKIVSTSSSGAQLTLSGTGTIKVGQTTTPFTVSNLSYTAVGAVVATLAATGTGTLSGANVNLNATITSTDLATGQGTAVFADPTGTDSLTVFFKISDLNANTYTITATVIAGTGAYAGATGSLPITVTNTSKKTFTLTGTGAVGIFAAGASRPTITSVKVSGADPSFLAPNAWVEIQGPNLVPANTSGVMTWSTAPEFNVGRMPIQVGPISAKINGKSAYIYLYCHACGDNQTDQINILTSLDATVGQMLIVATNGSLSSAPFIVTMQAASPSFLRWDLPGHPVATHADNSLLGPTSLFPGLTTPARKLEPILIYGDGFGLPTGSLVEGSSTQLGVLPDPQPACTFGTTPVAAKVVLVSPGLYGIGITVPDTAVSGDNLFACWYNGAATPAGNVITVQ